MRLINRETHVITGSSNKTHKYVKLRVLNSSFLPRRRARPPHLSHTGHALLRCGDRLEHTRGHEHIYGLPFWL